ncbi:unnamed protein product [Prunus armeniaca]
MVWICRNPGTLDGVLPYTLSRVVYAHKICHRLTSIEDFAVRASELSPPVGRLIPGHMVVEDSSMWFSQTIPVLDCFPGA